MTRSHTLALAVQLALACTPAPKTVTVAAASPTAQTQTPAPAPAHPLALTLAFEQHVAGDVRGVAVDHGRLYVNVAGALQVFEHGAPVTPTPHAWQPGQPLVVVGDGAFDPVSFRPYASPVPKGLQCAAIAFSADASRMSAYCFDPGGAADAVHVYNTRTGAEVARFDDFHTAAPIRSGTITTSGNFVFWVARASGAFEEIKSHVTGPIMSSHSVMSPSEDMLFTTIDKNWFSEDKSPARMLDPKNGRLLFELGSDVDWAWFAQSGGLFALRHSIRWADMMHAADSKKAWITVHAGATDSARADLDDAMEAAFSRDGAEVAVRGESGAIRVYAVAICAVPPPADPPTAR